MTTPTNTPTQGSCRCHNRPAESRVLMIATGGTIMMVPGQEGLEPARGFVGNCLEPRPSFNDGGRYSSTRITIDRGGSLKELRTLRTPPSKHNRHTRYCVYEFEQLLDSSAVDSESWNRIAELIVWNYEAFDGFVILHGTDTMAYTSSALSFMLRDLGKPVVLTGSQAAMAELGTDATDNLLGAVIIAGHFTIPEVTLYFNYHLYRGNRTTKVSASDFAAFASPNHLPLATFSSVGARVFWRLVFRPTQIRPLTLAADLNTSRVACIRLFPGIQASMLSAVLTAPNLRGLVLETFGAGNAPKGHNDAITRVLGDAVDRGVVIVNVTQCLSGNVGPLYAPATALQRVGVVLGFDMTTEAALTKLAFLLSHAGATPERVACDMTRDLAGELTGVTETEFRHPDEVDMTPKRATLLALRFAIEDGDLVTYRALMGREDKVGVSDVDEEGCTPLHVAAGAPNVGIVIDLLARGASVHVRNQADHSPLWVAFEKGRRENVSVLRSAGAHLYPDENGRR